MNEIKRIRVEDIDERNLMMADPDDVRAVMAMTAEKRSANRVGNRGYSQNKGRTMRGLGHIPSSVYWNPQFAHIFRNPDPVEKEKMILKLMKLHPKLFMAVDKM